jgi:hypothetical protein
VILHCQAKVAMARISPADLSKTDVVGLGLLCMHLEFFEHGMESRRLKQSWCGGSLLAQLRLSSHFNVASLSCGCVKESSTRAKSGPIAHGCLSPYYSTRSKHA